MHPAKLVVGELVKLVDEADLDAACIFVVAPSTVIHARYLCLKLREELPNLKIVIGAARPKTSPRRPNACAIHGRMSSPPLADAVVQLAIIMQILHNEAEAYDNLLQQVFFYHALLCRRANLLQKKIFSDDAARLIFSESASPRQCDGVKEKRSAGGVTSEHSATSRG